MKKQDRCAFCGKPTNYYSYELFCYVCPQCLGEYTKASETPVCFDDYKTGTKIKDSNKTEYIIKAVIDEDIDEFDKYLNEILSKINGDNRSFSINYEKWQANMALVSSLINKKFNDSEWYHRYTEEILNIVSYAIIIMMYLEMKNNKEEVEK